MDLDITHTNLFLKRENNNVENKRSKFRLLREQKE